MHKSVKGHVMIIDDDALTVNLLSSYFRERGLKVSAVGKVEEAHWQVYKTKPDIIFLDYRMRPVTGKDILAKLRASGIETPVVMMSAYKTRDAIFEMKELGATEYLGKPFDFDLIDSILNSILGER